VSGRTRRRTWAVLAAAGLALLLSSAPGAALAATDDGEAGDILVTVPESAQGTEITDAQFRWGINTEAGSGAFAGGCNFLSAGKAGNSGGAVVWTAGSGLYRAQSGKVRIVKPDATGAFAPASFDERCLDPSGEPVSVASLTSTSHNQVLIDGGVGRVVPGAGLEIRWKGSFTVAFYGGMTYWSVSDPVLTVDAKGRGQVVATASGYGSSMEDLTKWEPLKPQSIVLADLRGVDVGSVTGFATDPLYLGVEVSDAGQTARTTLNAEYWGSFPSSFVQFQKLTGQAGYWLTTGGQRDRAKVPTTLYISYDASAPVVVDPPTPGGDDDTSTDPRNEVRERPSTTAQAAPQAAIPPTAAAIFPISDASAVLPQGKGLLAEAFGGQASPYTLPLLGVLLSLSASIVAVLNIMQLLPWQLSRRGG